MGHPNDGMQLSLDLANSGTGQHLNYHQVGSGSPTETTENYLKDSNTKLEKNTLNRSFVEFGKQVQPAIVNGPTG